MIIRDRLKFALGLVGLATFLAVLAAWVSPIAGHRSGLAWADYFFNQLGKNSAYFLPELLKHAPDFRGKAFDVTFEAGRADDAARLAKVFAVGMAGQGSLADASGKKVHLQGDLGAAAMALLADAEPLHRNQDDAIRQKYGMSGREVLYWYWSGFGEIYKYYMGKVDVPAANFASEMRTKVCEPIYNFWGTTPTRASEAAGKLTFLLVFYVIYTVWFGFSIMFLFEGMDIGTRRAKKQEV